MFGNPLFIGTFSYLFFNPCYQYYTLHVGRVVIIDVFLLYNVQLVLLYVQLILFIKLLFST